VQIDRGSGVAARIHVFTDTNFNFLESLAYDARESILWTTNDSKLLRVQPSSFVTTVVGTIPLDDVDGLAVHPITGALFGVTYGGNDLIRIDKSDASAAILNGNLEQGSRLEDLAFDSTGRLYVLTSRALVEVNPTTGARISKVQLHGASSLEGLVWDTQRGAFLSAADRGRFKDLVSINRTTGKVSFLSSSLNSGFRDIEALAFAPGTPIVPVAMQALDSRRDATGVTLAWETFETGAEFVVQRARHAEGPFLVTARVREPVAGRPGAWRFEHRDSEAGAEFGNEALFYRVGAQDALGEWTWLEFELAAPPRGVTLRPNSPNPFNPTTAFAVTLVAPGRVELTVYDVRGRALRHVDGSFGTGSHVLVWDGRDDDGRALAGGAYPYVLSAGGRTLRGRAVLVK
jgi:hypothetical protein